MTTKSAFIARVYALIRDAEDDVDSDTLRRIPKCTMTRVICRAGLKNAHKSSWEFLRNTSDDDFTELVQKTAVDLLNRARCIGKTHGITIEKSKK